MKIAVISPSKSSLDDIGRALQAKAHTVILVEGGKGKMRAVAEQEKPELMLVEGMCCEPGELAQVEYVTHHHPSIDVILLCSSNTPEFLINAMRAGVREVLPSPVTGAALDATVRRLHAKRGQPPAHSTGTLLAFMSSKGGSGATFITTNVGMALAEGKSVLLVDLNLQFGDALSYLHDSKPSVTLADVARDTSRLDASLLAASTISVAPNYSVLPAPGDLSQFLDIRPEQIDAILRLALTQYDFVLVDVGRAVTEVSIKVLDCASRIFIVMQAGLQCLHHTHALLSMLHSLAIPPGRVELIVNRFEKNSDIGLDTIRRTLGNIPLHAFPNAYREANASANRGEPLRHLRQGGALARSLAEFARTFVPVPQASRGLLGRLFQRA